MHSRTGSYISVPLCGSQWDGRCDAGSLISGFADAASVPGYAVSAMNWALSQSIMKGSGTQLLSGNTCTRAQIVTFLWRMYTEK